MIQNGRHVTEYTYDELSQLVSVEDGRKKSEYIYDPVGNRLSMARGGRITNYTYDEDNRLLSAGKTIFTHDANGNRIREQKGKKHGLDYEYDAANRLIRVIQGKGTIAYEYDGDGNKVGQTITRKRRTEFFSFINDVATALPVILAENGSEAEVNYVYGLGLISQAGEKLGKKKNKPFEFFYHFDGLGSVGNLTDRKGRRKERYDYDAWGERSGGPKDSDPPHRFRFTGEELDADTGLYYLRVRWYDPRVGRFLTKDPFGGFIDQPKSLNLYTYVRNNPVRYLDPMGLVPLERRVITDQEAVAIPTGLGVPLQQLRDPAFLGANVSTAVENIQSVGGKFFRKLFDAFQFLSDLILPFSPSGVSEALVEGTENWAPVIEDLKDMQRGEEPKTWGGSTFKMAKCNFDLDCIFANQSSQ